LESFAFFIGSVIAAVIMGLINHRSNNKVTKRVNAMQSEITTEVGTQIKPVITSFDAAIIRLDRVNESAVKTQERLLEQFEGRFKRLENDYERMRSEYQEERTLRRNLESEMKDLRVNQAAQQKEYLEKINSLQSALSGVNGVLDKVEAERDALALRVKELETKAAQRHDEMNRYQKEYAELSNELTVTKRELAQTRETLLVTQADLADAHRQIETLKAQIAELQKPMVDIPTTVTAPQTIDKTAGLHVDANGEIKLGTPPEGIKVPPFSTAAFDTTGKIISSGEIESKDTPQ
jgi:chromosome segregation ATPase